MSYTPAPITMANNQAFLDDLLCMTQLMEHQDRMVRLWQAAPQLLAACQAIEELLGNNLQWFADQFDLEVRQGNVEVMHRHMELTKAWTIAAKASAAATRGTV